MEANDSLIWSDNESAFGSISTTPFEMAVQWLGTTAFSIHVAFRSGWSKQGKTKWQWSGSNYVYKYSSRSSWSIYQCKPHPSFLYLFNIFIETVFYPIFRWVLGKLTLWLIKIDLLSRTTLIICWPLILRWLISLPLKSKAKVEAGNSLRSKLTMTWPK